MMRWSVMIVPLLLLLGETATPRHNQDSTRKVILIVGNSLTAGYGLDPSQSFPALIQEKIDRFRLNFEVVNGGVSGDTSAGGLRRIKWLLKREVDILVLELGANDALRGIELGSTRRNLQGIIDELRSAYPSARLVVAGMLAPPNLGPDYTGEFRDLFVELAQANDAALIPFLLDGVAGKPELNLPDGIHPNPEGQKIVADNVWKVLEPLLNQVQKKK